MTFRKTPKTTFGELVSSMRSQGFSNGQIVTEELNRPVIHASYASHALISNHLLLLLPKSHQSTDTITLLPFLLLSIIRFGVFLD